MKIRLASGLKGFEPRSDIQVLKKQNVPQSLVMIQYCGEPPCLIGSVLGLRPAELEFQILCM